MATIVSPFITEKLDYTDISGEVIKSFTYTVNVPKLGEYLRNNMKLMQDAEKAKNVDALLDAYIDIVHNVFGASAKDLIDFYTFDGALEGEAFISDMADVLTRVILPKVQEYQKKHISTLKAMKDG